MAPRSQRINLILYNQIHFIILRIMQDLTKFYLKSFNQVEFAHDPKFITFSCK